MREMKAVASEPQERVANLEDDDGAGDVDGLGRKQVAQAHLGIPHALVTQLRLHPLKPNVCHEGLLHVVGVKEGGPESCIISSNREYTWKQTGVKSQS